MREISNKDIALLRSMANGDDTNQSSKVLGYAYSSIETLKCRLYKKINVNNSAHAVAWGFRNKIIEI